MKLKSFDHLNCSLAQTLSVVGEHWTMLIIRDAFFGLRHPKGKRWISKPGHSWFSIREPGFTHQPEFNLMGSLS